MLKYYQPVVIFMNKTYLCIDFTTFYASVECIERGLDPYHTDLVVANPKRYKGTICLAITPHMKAMGIKIVAASLIFLNMSIPLLPNLA